MALTKIALKDRCWTRRTILQRVEAIDVSITVGRLKVLSPRMTHFRNDRYPSFFNYPGHVMLYMQFFQMYAIMMLCGSCEICFNNAERPFETKSLRITAAEHVMFFCSGSVCQFGRETLGSDSAVRHEVFGFTPRVHYYILAIAFSSLVPDMVAFQYTSYRS